MLDWRERKDLPSSLVANSQSHPRAVFKATQLPDGWLVQQRFGPGQFTTEKPTLDRALDLLEARERVLALGTRAK